MEIVLKWLILVNQIADNLLRYNIASLLTDSMMSVNKGLFALK